MRRRRNPNRILVHSALSVFDLEPRLPRAARLPISASPMATATAAASSWERVWDGLEAALERKRRARND